MAMRVAEEGHPVKKSEYLLISVTYIVLTLFVTYPTVARLNTHYLGAGSDMWIFHWNDWWLRKCLLEWRNPFYTTWMFYPEGVSLVYHNFAWLNTLAWLPLSPLVGPIAAYNLIFILNLALGGVGMYALARYLVRNQWAAFLAGLIFAFWPFRMAHFNRPNLISTEWVPLFLLYLIRTVREGRKWRDGLLAGLFLGLTGLARWMHLALAGALAALYLGYSLLSERWRWDKRTFAALALTGLIAVLIVAPFGAPLTVSQILGEGTAAEAQIERAKKGTDLVGYFVPGRGHPVFRYWLADLWARMGQESFIGYTVLILMIYGVLRHRRHATFWLLTAGLLFVLSLGTELRIAGEVYQLPMPYRLVQSSLLASLLREPRRLNIVLGLPVAILAAYGLKELLDFLGQRRGNRAAQVVPLLIGILILFEYLHWPFPTVRPHISPFYQQIAQEPDEFALFELPMGATTPAKLYMYYATIHGKPLVEGHVSRLSESAYRFIDSVPLAHSLHQNNEIAPELADVSRQLNALAEADVRYVILHKDLAKAERVAEWRNWLAVAPIYEDERIIVYHTTLQYGRDFQFVGKVGDGVGIVEAMLSAEAVAQDGLLEADIVWGTQQPPKQEWQAYLALVGPTGQEAQSTAFEPSPGWPTSEWDQGAVARGRGALRIDPFIEGGVYAVTVGLLDPVSGLRLSAPLTIGQVEVQAVERVFEMPEIEVDKEVIFGEVLQLRGYDLLLADDQVMVTLHWQALQRMDMMYKFFVHLCDSENGALVAQADVMPHNWTYPTTWWEAGEFVSDAISLPLEGVPSGIYSLSVGVYEPDGERLQPSTGGDYLALKNELVVP